VTGTIELEVAVPGTREQVWPAISTGPGIGAWFVPTEVEGDAITLHFGPGVDEPGRITASEPPHRFTYGADQGGLTFDWRVRDAGDGTCVVRLVNGGFGSDSEQRGMEAGWRLFLENLRLYLTHFRGQPCRSILVTGVAPGPREAAWRVYAEALGVPAEAERGADVAATGDGVPPLAGTVERASPGMLTLLAREPAPGVVLAAAEGEGDTVYLSLFAYLYGDGAAAADAAEPAWQAWMQERFPHEP